MRTKPQIRKSYIELLNEENKLGMTPEKIEAFVSNPEEIAKIDADIDKELYVTKEYKGQIVSTERAFYIFCKVVVYSDLKTGRKIWNSFVKKMFLIYEMNKQSCIMAQRGAGKSFIASLYIIFKMYLLTYLDVCYCSNIPKQVRRFLLSTEAIIDNNELLLEKKDFKGIGAGRVTWGQQFMGYNNGTMEGTTVGTTPRGGHYNLVLVDDPLRDDYKYTDEFILNYFQGILRPTTYTKKARYIIQGTPQSDLDLFNTLMNESLDKNNQPIGEVVRGEVSAAGYYSQVFPAILNDKTKEVLIPEIWTYEELMKEKIAIGEIRFNRELLCKSGSFRNSLVSASLFRSCCDGELQLRQKGEEGKEYVISVDTATSDAPTADYCAMTVWEDDTKADKFIFRHLFHEKGYPITDPTGGTDDQAHKLLRLFNDFNKALVVIERNNAGIGLIQAVQALGHRLNTPIEVIEHYTHTVSTGKATKTSGKSDDVINYIEQGLKSGVIVFPADPEDIYTLDGLEKVKNEHLNFGVKKGKSGEKYEALAGHDDILDSAIMAFKHRGDAVDTLPMAITMSGFSNYDNPY